MAPQYQFQLTLQLKDVNDQSLKSKQNWNLRKICIKIHKISTTIIASKLSCKLKNKVLDCLLIQGVVLYYLHQKNFIMLYCHFQGFMYLVLINWEYNKPIVSG